MKRRLSAVLIILGAVLLALALGLWWMNRQEAGHARQFAAQVMPKVVEQIRIHREKEPMPDPYDDLTVTQIDGWGYVGYLSVPALEMEEPVLSELDMAGLEIAPCRYSGTRPDRALVIGGHNYSHNFGRLSQLQVGDAVTFVDMEGTRYDYRVSEVEILPPTAVEGMTGTDYALTLFTCTFGGADRIAVRCDLIHDV